MADKSGVYLVPNGAPVKRQLVARIRMLVAIGAWREGERIPSAGELAEFLGITENTVRSAYLILVRTGVLYGEPPIGTSVAIGAKSTTLLNEVIRETLSEPISLLCSLGVPRGLLDEQFGEIATKLYERNGEDAQEDG